MNTTELTPEDVAALDALSPEDLAALVNLSDDERAELAADKPPAEKPVKAKAAKSTAKKAAAEKKPTDKKPEKREPAAPAIVEQDYLDDGYHAPTSPHAVADADHREGFAVADPAADATHIAFEDGSTFELEDGRIADRVD